MKEKIFSHLISATITFRMIVYCNSIFDGNIIFMGYRTKTENHGNSRVWQAPPRMEILRRGWRYGYFLELHIKKTQWRGTKAVLGCQIWHKCQHFSAHYGYFFTLNPTKVPGYLQSRLNSVSGRAPRQSGTQKRTDNLKWVRGGRFKVKISRLKPTCIWRVTSSLSRALLFGMFFWATAIDRFSSFTWRTSIQLVRI